jgi:hypothetical protein
VAPLVIRGGVSRGFDSHVQYRGVYSHETGWRGKVKFFDRQVNFPTDRTPLDAALRVARWWESHLGPRWGDILTRYGWRRGGPGRSGSRIWRDAPWRIVGDKRVRPEVRQVPVPAGGERSTVDGVFYPFVPGEAKTLPVYTEPCRAIAWVKGERTEVPCVFDWRREAAWGLFAWLERRYGSEPVLWFREDAPDARA